VREAPYGVSEAELIARTGIAVPSTAAFLRIDEPHPWLVDRVWVEGASARLTDALRSFHKANPLLPGMPKEDLRGRVLPGAPAFLLDAILARTSGVVQEGDVVRLTSHKIALRQDEEAAVAAMEQIFLHAGLKVPAIAEAMAGSGVEPTRARSLLQMLFRQKRLVRVAEDLAVHASAISALRGLLAGRKGRRFSVSEFKEWTGVSRKYAIPLLEYLDRERVTRRDGDQRVIL
jgi:selenocysteine-specific elongation factor